MGSFHRIRVQDMQKSDCFRKFFVFVFLSRFKYQ